MERNHSCKGQLVAIQVGFASYVRVCMGKVRTYKRDRCSGYVGESVAIAVVVAEGRETRWNPA